MKQKTFAKALSSSGRKPDPARKTMILLKGFSRYQDWLKRYSHFKRLPLALLCEHALAKMAEIDRFEVPPGRYEKE
jgi:hypothetical protein